MKERPILFSGPMVRAILAGNKTQTRRIVTPPPNPEYLETPIKCERYHPTKIDRRDGEAFAGPEVFGFANEDAGWVCPYGGPGDRLWVRETFQFVQANSDGQRHTFKSAVAFTQNDYRWIEYAATPRVEPAIKWKPSIFMPRWASRINLENVAVRVERLQDISEADALAEGCKAEAETPYDWWEGYDARRADRHGNFNHAMVAKENYPVAPEWMIEARTHKGTRGCNLTAKRKYELLWNSINGPTAWDANPLVWVIEFKRV